jgi:hypothetical protein
VRAPAFSLAGEVPHEQTDEPRVRGKRELAHQFGRRHGVLEPACGLLESSQLRQRLSEVREEREARRVLGRQRRRRT